MRNSMKNNNSKWAITLLILLSFLSGCGGFRTFTLSAPTNSPASGQDGQAILSWDPSVPTATQPAVATGYKIYWGTQSGSYSNSVDVGNVVTYTLTGFQNVTTYYFAVTAYDITGGESVFSNEVFKTMPQVSSKPRFPFLKGQGLSSLH